MHWFYHLIKLFISFLLFFATLATSQSSPSWEDDPYHHIVNLSPNYVLEWSVNWSSRTILFNITVQTLGYIGFGLSSKGKMLGADLIIAGVNNSSPYLYDMHVAESSTRQPILDASQDYILHAAWENATHTSVSFSRQFETCDPHDYKINDDMLRFIWAYGTKDSLTQYHYQYRGDYQVYVLDPDYTPREIQEARRMGRQPTAEQLGDLQVWTMYRRQTVPQVKTAYWCSIHKGPVLQQKHSIVGFHFRWETPLQFNYTHHLLVNKCKAPQGVDPNQYFAPWIRNNTGEMCYFLNRNGARSDQADGNEGLPLGDCREIMHSYAIGQRMFFLPNHTGINIGLTPDEYYLLQVHYDNPNLNSDIIFDINLDFYYTPNIRQHEAGLATLGHNIPGSPSILIPPMSLHHTQYGHCGSTCTEEVFPSEGIFLIGIQHHTHYTGIRHRFRHFRGQTELPWIMDDNNYENKFQPTRHPRREIHIKPGDHLTTRCVYDNTGTGRATVGGFSTRQEMCVVYVWYYNKIPNFSSCRSEITSREYMWKYLGVRNLTWSDPAIEYLVTDPAPLQGMTVSQVATERVNWTEEKRAELEMDHKELPQMNTCDLIEQGSEGVEGTPKVTGYPKGVTEYVRRDEADIKCRRGRKNWSRFDNGKGIWKNT